MSKSADNDIVNDMAIHTSSLLSWSISMDRSFSATQQRRAPSGSGRYLCPFLQDRTRRGSGQAVSPPANDTCTPSVSEQISSSEEICAARSSNWTLDNILTFSLSTSLTSLMTALCKANGGRVAKIRVLVNPRWVWNMWQTFSSLPTRPLSCPQSTSTEPRSRQTTSTNVLIFVTLRKAVEMDEISPPQNAVTRQSCSRCCWMQP